MFFFFLLQNKTTKKKKASSHVQSACDEASVCVCIYIYITFIIIIDPSTPLSNICLKKKLQLLFISKIYIFYLFEKKLYIYTHAHILRLSFFF